jgi:hypothetical protein
MAGVRALGRGTVVGLLGAATVYGHVLYPVYIGLRSRGVVPEPPPDPDEWPSVSIVVSAYRESAVIGAKIDQLMAADYPGALEIIVVADDEETAAVARRAGVRVVSTGERLGKARAVNRGVSAAIHEIVVLTDANATLAPSSLRAAIRHFTDDEVGAVTGEKYVDDPQGAQGFYWRFESWLKRRESATGSTIGVVGEFLAFRRDVFRPLPVDTAVDDAWLALDVIESGLRVVYEPQAYSVEPPVPTYGEEWVRRTRIVAGNLDMMWRRRGTLSPGALSVTPQLWGHRVIRSSFGPMSHAALLAWSIPAARRSWIARAFLAANIFGVGSAGAIAAGRKNLSTPARLMGQVFFLQAVALGGVQRFVAHDRAAVWSKTDRPALPPRRGDRRTETPADGLATPAALAASGRPGSFSEPVIGPDAAATGPIILPPGFGAGRLFEQEAYDEAPAFDPADPLGPSRRHGSGFGPQ